MELRFALVEASWQAVRSNGAHQPRANGHDHKTPQLYQTDLHTAQLFSAGCMRWLGGSSPSNVTQDMRKTVPQYDLWLYE